MTASAIQLVGIHAGAGAGVSGAQDGPYVLREKGLVAVLEAGGRELIDLGDIPGVYETRFNTSPPGSANNLRNILQVNRHTHACVLGARRRLPKAFVLIVGGDHSLAIGTLAGLADACERLGLLWIDAHADFNTPASSPSGNVHGMSLAVACGRGLNDLVHVPRRVPMVREDDVFLLGARDVDPGERASLKSSRLRWLNTRQWRERGAIATVEQACDELAARCDHIHVSFDIDVLDPQDGLATGTPVADGLHFDEALAMLAALNRRGVIASAEFVEYNPRLDPAGSTAQRVLRLIGALLG